VKISALSHYAQEDGWIGTAGAGKETLGQQPAPQARWARFASLACHWGYSIIVARLEQVSTARMLRRCADWQLD